MFHLSFNFIPLYSRGSQIYVYKIELSLGLKSFQVFITLHLQATEKS